MAEDSEVTLELEAAGADETATEFPERFGKFVLTQRLGTGGMAEILLARAQGPWALEKPLVIKRILPHLAKDATFVEMFLSEAKIAARLHHPNVAQIYDLGRIVGRYFIAMEYIDGLTLAQMFLRSRMAKDPLPMTLVIHIVKEVALALHHAHEATDSNNRPLNLVHRDVSPSNIMVSKDGVVKLVDFGVAKANIQLHKTQAGSLKGKYAYMAPEQCEGDAVDCRADIFSLGVVLYEYTTGTRLFASKTPMETLRRILHWHVPDPKTVVKDYPTTLRDIVLKMLAAEPGERYQSAKEVHTALESFLAVVGGGMTTVELGRRVRELCQRRNGLPLAQEELAPTAPGPSVGTGTAPAPGASTTGSMPDEVLWDLEDALDFPQVSSLIEVGPLTPDSPTPARRLLPQLTPTSGPAVRPGAASAALVLLLGLVVVGSIVAWIVLLS